MRAYEIAAGSSSLEGLRRCERPDPSPLPHQILVRVKAASLNYRDLLIPRGHYMGGAVASSTIPLSDGAGEVVAIGGAPASSAPPVASTIAPPRSGSAKCSR
jgi:NADPH:quinone reductase-like Zn-dependent oxidoreductase